MCSWPRVQLDTVNFVVCQGERGKAALTERRKEKSEGIVGPAAREEGENLKFAQMAGKC